MLSEFDFSLISYCSECGSPKYKHFEQDMPYYTCFCKVKPLPIRKLKLVKSKENKVACVYSDNEEEKEIYGKTS